MSSPPIVLPVKMAVLDGSHSTDDKGGVSYLWTRDDNSPAAGVRLVFVYGQNVQIKEIPSFSQYRTSTKLENNQKFNSFFTLLCCFFLSIGCTEQQ